jgi:hypothetical protein
MTGAYEKGMVALRKSVVYPWESQEKVERVRARSTAGDAHAWDYDTGGGAAMALIGWVPALAYIGVLAGFRLRVTKMRPGHEHRLGT